MSGFPIQLAKVQPPPLRDDILSRERLNGWLEARVRHKVILVLAEAGYGKTTLLADWSRHTRRRTLWYRLDSDDRDWLTLLNHLVASGRQLDPGFGEESEELIGSLGPGGPTRAAIVSSLVRELSELSEGGATFIFDDFQAIEDTDDVVSIIRSLIERTAPSLSFILASRAEPQAALARLRAQGRLVRINSSDLQFDLDETQRLFRDTYGQPLATDVVEDITTKTKGWAASLELVHQATVDRTLGEVRPFIDNLSGARGDLHNFLAEEVVGQQPLDLQRFLMHISLLSPVDHEAARVAFPDGAGQIDQLISRAKRIGVLRDVGDGGAGPWAFHPLVAQFLQSRLIREINDEGVRRVHLAVASHFKSSDWRLSATHFRAAGEMTSADNAVREGIDQILARGEAAAALEFVRVAKHPAPHLDVLESRILLQRGLADDAVEVGRRAASATAPGSRERAAALLNLATLLANSWRRDELIACLHELEALPVTDRQHSVVKAMAKLVQSTDRGDLIELRAFLEELAARDAGLDGNHYLGVTYLNLATVPLWLGDPAETLRLASEAERILKGTSSSFELNAVYQVRARALSQLADWPKAKTALSHALEYVHPLAYAEAVIEGAETTALYGDDETLRTLHALSADLDVAHWDAYRRTAMLLVQTRFRDIAAASAGYVSLAATGSSFFVTCGRFRRELALARAALLLDLPELKERIDDLSVTASLQRSPVQQSIVHMLRAVCDGPRAVAIALHDLPPGGRHVASMLAEELLQLADSLDSMAQEVLSDEITIRRDRWIGSLRQEVLARGGGGVFAARTLDVVGNDSDVPLLRAFARARRRGRHDLSALGQSLARKHAARIFVEDMGRVRVLVGGEEVPSGGIRRKSLALLCFLLAQPTASASRDQVLEALWPDFDPSTAVNSLNQTIYFLRRSIEPGFREESTPGYVRYEGDVVWLDLSLVSSRSREAREVLFGPTPSPIELFGVYPDRFATDFAYESWADDYRNTLHAAFLAIVEKSIAALSRTENWEAAITLAQRALMLDPMADAIEACLLRLYRDSGATSAAAEQYAHYASTIRDELGVEPPRLEDV